MEIVSNWPSAVVLVFIFIFLTVLAFSAASVASNYFEYKRRGL